MPGDSTDKSAIDRRQLFKLLGAGLATTSLGACMERPLEQILPWANRPPDLVPGVPLMYATSLAIDGYATGLLGKCIDARPVKLEGNPQHPTSLGATTAIEQASLYGLYDPDRARNQAALDRGAPTTRRKIIAGLRAGRRLAVVLGPQSSPVIGGLLDRLRERYPEAMVVHYAPLARRAVYRGAEIVFGRPLEPVFDFTRAEVVVALDADVAAAMPGSTRYARDLAAGRRPSSNFQMSRLYVAEPSPTPTGSVADHRLAMPAGAIAALAATLLNELSGAGQAVPGGEEVRSLLGSAPLPESAARWARAVAADLAGRRGAGAVVCGDRQPPGTHALVHLINAALGNLGRAVMLIDPIVRDPLGPTLGDLSGALEAGAIDTLVIAGCDPVGRGSGPALGRLIASVERSLHVSMYPDATTERCRWSMPLAHPYEHWSDGRGHDGTLTVGQPLIRPLHDGIAASELLADLAGASATSHDLVRGRYATGGPEGWTELVRTGFVEGSASRPQRGQPAPTGAAAMEIRRALEPRGGGFEIDLAASPAIHDGQFARIPWLQELPKPVSKLTWGNAAELSPATAERLGIGDGDVVRVSVDGHAIEIPAQVIGGHADGAVSIELGYGGGVGVDAYVLRRAGHSILGGAELAKTRKRVTLAVTQREKSQHGRDLALTSTLERYRAEPDFGADHRGPLPSLLPEPEWSGPQWAMSIDTSVCTGCSSCVIACQVENNVQTVGRERVIENREMHWLRIDTYVDGDRPVNQPMLCQHCELAPCEYVCPTYATVHSPDGLNEMVYNRCIGTRFCSNNCPYKIRRFNWFDYSEQGPDLIKLSRNPDVTVRGRGVMEKCTYCVQRIRGAEIAARIENRDIRADEVVTACQQACPTRAIEFGLLGHAELPMVKMREEGRAYAVLHRQGTRPRTMYLARIRNLNPELGE